MFVLRTRSSGEFAAPLRRPRYRSFVFTVSLSRITSAMFMTSGCCSCSDAPGAPGWPG